MKKLKDSAMHVPESPEIQVVPLVQEQAPPGAHAKITPPECATPASDPPTVPSTKAFLAGKSRTPAQGFRVDVACLQNLEDV